MSSTISPLMYSLSCRPTLSTNWSTNHTCWEKRSHHYMAASSIWGPKWSDCVLPDSGFTIQVWHTRYQDEHHFHQPYSNKPGRGQWQ